MDFVKFWQLVEKYPWLVRVVIFGPSWGKLDSELADYPISICGWFKPSTIKEEIEYIAFRPWNSLDLKVLPCQRSAEKRSGVMAVDSVVSIEYYCYWHARREGEFKRCISSIAGYGALNENQIGELSVEQMLGHIREEHGILDGVVRESMVSVQKYKRSTNPFERVINRLQQENDRVTSYEIFLPPD